MPTTNNKTIHTYMYIERSIEIDFRTRVRVVHLHVLDVAVDLGRDVGLEVAE
jgi:hypothetical protein